MLRWWSCFGHRCSSISLRTNAAVLLISRFVLSFVLRDFTSICRYACSTIWNLAASANPIVMSDMIQSGVIAGLCRMCRGKKSLQSAAVGALWNFSATHAKLVVIADGCDGLWGCALAGVQHADAALRNICACCPEHVDDVICSGVKAVSRLSGSRSKLDDATLAVRKQVVLDLLK